MTFCSSFEIISGKFTGKIYSKCCFREICKYVTYMCTQEIIEKSLIDSNLWQDRTPHLCFLVIIMNLTRGKIIWCIEFMDYMLGMDILMIVDEFLFKQIFLVKAS